MLNLTGKTAVVTGAASGIGYALAQRFAAEGMNVVMVDIEADALRAAADPMPKAQVMTVVTDVANAEQMDALGARVLERFGAVHVVCNNAGVGAGFCSSWQLSTKDWQWVLGVNLFGVIHGIRVFGPLLVAQDEGHIVNTASVAGLCSVPGMAAYNASKHAVVTLSETLWSELRARGSRVGVSVLCPGFVKTSIHESERNRPEALRNPPSELSEAEQSSARTRREVLAQLVAAGQSPDSVAQQVLDSIRGDRRFYILTHPEMLPTVEGRMRNILDGRDPEPPALSVSGVGRPPPAKA